MNRAQKIALFNLIVVLSSLALSGLTIWILFLKSGFPDAYMGLALLGICALVAVSPSIFKDDALGGLFYQDLEREIHRKSLAAAYGAFWVVFSAGCMVPAIFLDPGATLPANVLPMLLCVSILTVIVVQSSATLAFYGRAEKNADL